jgi:SRSO17 transposase
LASGVGYNGMRAATPRRRKKATPDAAQLHQPAVLSRKWVHAWTGVVERVGRHFPRAEARQHAGAYLRGLLSPVERKNGWQLAEAVGDPTPYALQHLLGRAHWDADAVRDDLRAYVVEHLGDRRGVLAIDETGFLKKGVHSVGVQRQYSGTAGRIENCQVGVFLVYATPRGRTFVDRALYLPESWTCDRTRCEHAGVPADIPFATKPQLALQMLRRAIDKGVPAAWVVADEVYGNDSNLRRWLEERRQPYVLAVASWHRIWQSFRQVKMSELVQQVPAGAWQRLSAGDGAKGPRWYDWAYARLPNTQPRSWQRGLLYRRSLEDPTEIAYYAVFAHRTTSLPDIARAAGSRWAIEESFESAKGEVGLDQYEVRSWAGWHRHITLALFAHAFLTVQRAAAADGSSGEEISPPSALHRSDPADRTRGPSPALVVAVECAA